MTRPAPFLATVLLALSVLALVAPSARGGAAQAFGGRTASADRADSRSHTATFAAATATVVARDEVEIAGIFGHCRAFDPSGCPFMVASTSGGSGHTLYAVDLERDAGDACASGIAYFFRGRTLLTNTAFMLPRAGVALPGMTRGKPVVAADGPRRFVVRFEVNPSKLAPCTAYGTAGTDAYIYGWTGSKMVVLSGRPPRPPHVLAPTIRLSDG